MAAPKLDCVERACKNCGKRISFPREGRGLARVHCSMECQTAYARAQLRRRVASLMCRVDGCSASPSRISAMLCETHFYRLRRTGTTDDRAKAPYRERSHGYLARTNRDHPASSSNGLLYQHREVLYDTIGPGAHACHWCAKEIEWFTADRKRMLVADHLDGDKVNNDPTNLVPACLHCNGNRGLFEAWARRHKDDPFMLQLLSDILDGPR